MKAVSASIFFIAFFAAAVALFPRGFENGFLSFVDNGSLLQATAIQSGGQIEHEKDTVGKDSKDKPEKTNNGKKSKSSGDTVSPPSDDNTAIGIADTPTVVVPVAPVVIVVPVPVAAVPPASTGTASGSQDPVTETTSNQTDATTSAAPLPSASSAGGFSGGGSPGISETASAIQDQTPAAAASSAAGSTATGNPSFFSKLAAIFSPVAREEQTVLPSNGSDTKTNAGNTPVQRAGSLSVRTENSGTQVESTTSAVSIWEATSNRAIMEQFQRGFNAVAVFFGNMGHAISESAIARAMRDWSMAFKSKSFSSSGFIANIFYSSTER